MPLVYLSRGWVTRKELIFLIQCFYFEEVTYDIPWISTTKAT